jgi:pimeloyl-ACP methyl ester carboxylesterase
MDIAYQVFGNAPPDLLVLPGPFVPVDTIDAEPSMYRFHRRLASFSRVIRFDQCGIGLSSRVPSMDVVGPTFWAEDAIAVMDAVGCQQATIFASNYTGMSGLVLAADYPERVRGLVIVNGAARTLWAPDYPVGTEGNLADPFMTVATEPDAVEQGFDALKIVAPSVAGDNAFRTWWDLAGNRAASPSMARAHTKLLAEADVRDTLARITAPTLIVTTQESGLQSVEAVERYAKRFPNARVIVLPGDSYHIAAVEPELCAQHALEFMTQVSGRMAPGRPQAAE